MSDIIHAHKVITSKCGKVLCAPTLSSHGHWWELIESQVPVAMQALVLL